jgi:hypothetical protein
LENPAQQDVVAHAPGHVQLWLIDADCTFYDRTSTTILDQLASVHGPHVDTEESIATLQKISSIDLNEALPLNRTELFVKTPNGGQQISGLVDCVATLDFVSEDYVQRFALNTSKSLTKTHV